MSRSSSPTNSNSPATRSTTASPDNLTILSTECEPLTYRFNKDVNYYRLAIILMHESTVLELIHYLTAATINIATSLSHIQTRFASFASNSSHFRLFDMSHCPYDLNMVLSDYQQAAHLDESHSTSMISQTSHYSLITGPDGTLHFSIPTPNLGLIQIPILRSLFSLLIRFLSITSIISVRSPPLQLSTRLHFISHLKALNSFISRTTNKTTYVSLILYNAPTSIYDFAICDIPVECPTLTAHLLPRISPRSTITNAQPSLFANLSDCIKSYADLSIHYIDHRNSSDYIYRSTEIIFSVTYFINTFIKVPQPEFTTGSSPPGLNKTCNTPNLPLEIISRIIQFSVESTAFSCSCDTPSLITPRTLEYYPRLTPLASDLSKAHSVTIFFLYVTHESHRSRYDPYKITIYTPRSNILLLRRCHLPSLLPALPAPTPNVTVSASTSSGLTLAKSLLTNNRTHSCPTNVKTPDLYLDPQLLHSLTL